MPVYLVRAGENGPVKIGFTARGTVRLTKIQTDNPEKLIALRFLIGDKQTEAALHARFAAQRLRGEWFSFSPEMLGDLGVEDAPAEARRSGGRYRERVSGWTPEARARQSEVQRQHFADPITGALRRERMRAHRLARVQVSSIRELATRAGSFFKLAQAIGVEPAIIYGWHHVPRRYLEAISIAARVPLDRLECLAEPAQADAA